MGIKACWPVHEIFVHAYSFTSAPIAKALVAAHKRSIKVEAILDKSQSSEKYTSAAFLASRIPTFIDDRHAIAHNKIMIIGKGTVITGWFNFTRAEEEKNAENLLILKSKKLAGSTLKTGASTERTRKHIPLIVSTG